MLTAIITIVLLPLFSWIIYWYCRVYYFETYLKNVPGTTGLPLLGHMLEINSPTKLLGGFLKFQRIYKGSYKMFLGSQPHLIVTEPEDVKFFLSTSPFLKKSEQYEMFTRWIGNSLLISSGDKWRKQRRIMTPAFHLNVLETFIDVFNSQSHIFVEKLLEESHKGNIDIYPFAERCMLDSICETAMGTSINTQNNKECNYAKSIETLSEIYLKRSTSPILINDFLYFFSNVYRKEKRAIKIAHEFTNYVITQRKNFLNSCNKGNEKTLNNTARKTKKPLLDLLLEYSKTDPSFTDTDLRNEVDTFVVAGYDTTATTITFILYCLARHPDIQQKVYEELKAIFADDPQRKPTSADLQAMKYTEMVIKEVLRLYTPAPLIGRTLENDVNWNGVKLPKGLMVLIILQIVHLSIDHWGENYETFDPERFNNENSQARHPYAFVPFSMGIRSCIGSKYAMMQLKCVMATVLRRIEVFPANPDKDVILKYAAILKPANGVYIQLKSR